MAECHTEKDVGNDDPDEECPICRQTLDQDTVKVYEKGIFGLIRCAEQRGDDRLATLFRSKLSIDAPVKVRLHGACRKSYTLPRNVERARIQACTSEGPSPKKLRSSLSPFDWKMIVFLWEVCLDI